MKAMIAHNRLIGDDFRSEVTALKTDLADTKSKIANVLATILMHQQQLEVPILLLPLLKATLENYLPENFVKKFDHLRCCSIGW